MPPAREIYCSKSVKYGVVSIVKVQCFQLIVWKFDDFCPTQILREIKTPFLQFQGQKLISRKNETFLQSW